MSVIVAHPSALLFTRLKETKGSFREGAVAQATEGECVHKRFDGSVVKRAKMLFSQSPPPLRGAPSRREPWERSPRVSSSHFNKSAVCYVAIFTNIPNSERGRHNGYARTLDHPPFKFFWFFSRKKRTEKSLLKLTPQTNFKKFSKNY